MQAPKISVVMSVYNNAPYLPKSIESILGQTCGDFEFIVIDDGSTDGSAAIMDGYASRDARMRVVHQENRGTIAAASRGLGLAQAELIARMDGDDIADPLRFEKQVAFLDAHDDVGALGTWIRVIDEDDAPRLPGGDPPTDPATITESLRHSSPIMNPTAMMRKSVADRVGGYRPAYRHCEDYDYWLRFSEQAKLANLPERLLLYRYYGGQVSQKHATTQLIGTVIAYAAYQERIAGRADPTEGLTEMPRVDALRRLFGRDDLPRLAREFVLPQIEYRPDAFRNGGTELLVEALRQRELTDLPRSLKVAARLLRTGQYGNAARIAKAAIFG
ncbi:glycosyltransferase family 2 protein [Sphingopyxis sp. R3-92]|uniref:glycosyltransferase family 2 protein n=1 Tax=Sphingopyxis sp. R3-92 TaxID=3158553 RepID=UPI003EE7C126